MSNNSYLFTGILTGATSIYCFWKYNNQKIYSYKDVIVTGEHFVYDNGVHKTIAECNESILINDYENKEELHKTIDDSIYDPKLQKFFLKNLKKIKFELEIN